MVRKLDLGGVSGDDLRKAVPYQLSLVSPFDPDEVCFAMRAGTLGGCAETVLDYSKVDDIDNLTCRLPAASFYPTAFLAEHHVWEELVLQKVRHLDLPPEGCYLFIRFSGAVAYLGMLGACLWPSRAVPFAGGERTAWLEQVYNSMLTLLADFSAGHPDATLSRIFLVGDDDRRSGFVESYGNSLPAPVELVFVAGNRAGARKNLMRKVSGERPSEIYHALFAVDRERLPRLEPAARLRRPFRASFCRVRLQRLAILLVMVAAAWLAAEWSSIRGLESRLATARRRITELRPSVDRLLAMRQELDRSATSEARSASVLDMLVQIRAAKPEDLHFSSIHYARDNRVSLQGSAQSADSPVRFVKKLEKSPLVSDVELRHVSRTQAEDSSEVGFLIEVLLPND